MLLLCHGKNDRHGCASPKKRTYDGSNSLAEADQIVGISLHYAEGPGIVKKLTRVSQCY